jgi:hypothetical protein
MLAMGGHMNAKIIMLTMGLVIAFTVFLLKLNLEGVERWFA